VATVTTDIILRNDDALFTVRVLVTVAAKESAAFQAFGLTATE
jgi:hypothetical protein